MIITLLLEDGGLPVSIELIESVDIDTLKNVVIGEFNLQTSFHLIHEGKVLQHGTLTENNIKNSDIIFVARAVNIATTLNDSSSSSSSSVAGTSSVPTVEPTSGNQRMLTLTDIPMDVSPENLITLVRNNPQLLQQLESSDSAMAEAIRQNDIINLRKQLMARYLNQHKRVYENQQELNRIAENPDSEESQRKIAEKIREDNIRENMELAMENIPESFTQVNMLYINCQINDNDIRAFVDSGAQSTIMSSSCVERCGLSRLVDTRYSGEARGVGTGKILGRIHIAQMKLGQSFFPVSITVLEKSDVDFLFGLDMLKRHRCCIDLANNVLRIEGHSGNEVIPFL